MTTKSDRPNDLIYIRTASNMSGKSSRPIRRWFSSSVGKLTRWEAEGSGHGGPVNALVSARELMSLLAETQKMPTQSDGRPGRQSRQTGAIANSETPHANLLTPIQAIQMEVFEEKAKVRVIEAEKSALVAEIEWVKLHSRKLEEQLKEQAQQAEAELRHERHRTQETREDLLAARDRANALEAENRALRATQGLSWWRRMIGGPAPAELTEA